MAGVDVRAMWRASAGVDVRHTHVAVTDDVEAGGRCSGKDRKGNGAVGQILDEETSYWSPTISHSRAGIPSDVF